MQLYEKAAGLGYANGYYSIGEIYKKGDGVKEDQLKANEWYLKGAIAGDPSAQDTMGVRISEGVGTTPNNKKAVAWFKKSAEQGHVYGSCNLALHYSRGWGVRKSKLLALKWSFVSNSLDGLKCAPADFAQLLKPDKRTIRQAEKLSYDWLRNHPKLTNNFDERPWLGEGTRPVTVRVP